MVLLQYGGHNKKPRGTGHFPSKDSALCFSLVLNVILVLSLMYLTIFLPTCMSPNDIGPVQGNDILWHGGHPANTRAGSCWCGAEDKYCMCTPNIAIDLVIVSGESKEYLWLVRRKDTDQLATMGGFVDVDETVEYAVKRELKEEMGIDLQEEPTLFGVYSDPRRDNRRRNVSAVFAVYLEGAILPRAGDDAKEVKKIRLDDIEQHAYFADHRTILLDYRRFVRGEPTVQSTEGDFASNIIRSTCAQTSAMKQ